MTIACLTLPVTLVHVNLLQNKPKMQFGNSDSEIPLPIYGALATSHKGKSRVDAEADLDRLYICIVGVECGVM